MQVGQGDAEADGDVQRRRRGREEESRRAAREQRAVLSGWLGRRGRGRGAAAAGTGPVCAAHGDARRGCRVSVWCGVVCVVCCGQPVGSPVEEEINHLGCMETASVCRVRCTLDGGGLDEVSETDPMRDARRRSR